MLTLHVATLVCVHAEGQCHVDVLVCVQRDGAMWTC